MAGIRALTAAAYTKSLLRTVPLYNDPSDHRKETHHRNVHSAVNLERIKGTLQSSVHPLDMYQSIAKRRVSETGDWVRNEQLFQT
ncbi:hypothetical protein BDW59DRAFT_16987 [Aspergillus cavernicola]|uniref:Uncharacterized protein n=1 Tax=Aspergillus cavernicola TaxID=176166 RepID=A0ABR4HIB5_9EURO